MALSFAIWKTDAFECLNNVLLMLIMVNDNMIYNLAIKTVWDFSYF